MLHLRALVPFPLIASLVAGTRVVAGRQVVADRGRDAAGSRPPHRTNVPARCAGAGRLVVQRARSLPVAGGR